jgi:hypothetical protein
MEERKNLVGQRRRRFSSRARLHAGYCCTDERKRAGTGGRKLGGSEASRCGAGRGPGLGLPQRFCPNRVQVEWSEVRILFARFGSLLSGRVFPKGEAST